MPYGVCDGVEGYDTNNREWVLSSATPPPRDACTIVFGSRILKVGVGICCRLEWRGRC